MSIITERIGDWTQVAGGGRFYPFDPRPEEIDIRVIAAALAKLCRFGGHCSDFYSVAQHSVLVSQYCAPEDALWGLLHDATEAYLGDVCRPIKRHPAMAAYVQAEKRLMCVICSRFGLSGEMPASVKRADEILLATEARDLMGDETLETWERREEPLPYILSAWGPGRAEYAFLQRFAELTGQD